MSQKSGGASCSSGLLQEVDVGALSELDGKRAPLPEC